MPVCDRCGQDYEGFYCANCEALRSRNGLLAHQRRFIETWAAGLIDLRLKNSGGALHLELYDDRWHSYCGKPMFDTPDRTFAKDLPVDLCPDCAAVFAQIRQQVEANGGRAPMAPMAMPTAGA